MSRGGWATLALTTFLLAGCTGTPDIPPELTWPLRTDRIVIQTPPEPPTAPAPAGQFDAVLATFDSLRGKTADPSTLTESQRQHLKQTLDRVFGKPSTPTLAGDAEDAAHAAELSLSSEQLAVGMRLYRRHCLQCHGSAGDGRGPAGPWVYPLPRDFRNGQFKLVSTPGGTGVARRADIVRSIRQGVTGTSMPPFPLLPEAELEAMADAVLHLSMRGRAELAAIQSTLSEDEESPETVVRESLRASLRRQVESERSAVPADVPELTGEALAESVGRGERLFNEKDGAGCASCHLDLGRKSAYRYDIWGSVVRPNDLTAGVFKGGKRTQDIVWRLRCGVTPSGMPAVGQLSDEEVGHLVRYVKALAEREVS